MSRLGDHIHVTFTNFVLDALFKKNIFTTVDFVDANPEYLVKVTGLQYTMILNLREVIFSRCASTLCRGDQYYHELLDHCALISSGISKLDNILGGGFLTGNIYEFCGPSGCGKTQICATIIINHVITMGHSVIYIDTKNDITAHKLLTLIEKHPTKVTDIGSVMKKIVMYHVRSVYDMHSLLHSLTQKNLDDTNIPYRILVIDSLAALFYVFLGENQSEGLNMLCNVTSCLQYLAVECHVVVIVTNLLSTWSEAEEGQQVQRAALGKYWAHIPNTRINMKQLSKITDILLTIVKAANQSMGKVATVSTLDTGIS